MKRIVKIPSALLLAILWGHLNAMYRAEQKESIINKFQSSRINPTSSSNLLIPTATLTRQPPMGPVCQGNSVNFRLTISGGPSPWTVEVDSAGATIVISGITNSPHDFSMIQGNSGSINYFVKKVTDGNSIINSTIGSTVTVVVNPKPIVNAGNNLTLCNYTSIFSISGSIFNATGGMWSTSGTGSFSPSSTSLNANYIPTTADRNSGTISLILTTTGSGMCSAAKDTIIVNFVPDPFLNTSGIISDSVACVNSIITLGVSGLPPGSFTSFVQVLPSSVSLGGGLNVVSQPVLLSSSGNYLFTVSITQPGNNCQKNALLESIANVCMGFEEKYSNIEETVFPNPSSGFLEVSFNKSVSHEIIIELLSSRGELIDRLKNNYNQEEKNLELNIQHVSNGLYYLKIISGDRISIYKVIKN